ncbi:MAG: hypothetical protein PUF49_10480 [Firmicutes bacterium]|nr:hypothetical protein [Bacillota bacterium]
MLEVGWKSAAPRYAALHLACRGVSARLARKASCKSTNFEDLQEENLAEEQIILAKGAELRNALKDFLQNQEIFSYARNARRRADEI